ncbi:RidA family protein (plasmid) [Phyllobacterium sp. 628]|uniref:RidA family protein n=1 Tax=Phyllobacterium sp. 628 TaxID=2718938 RepID=UPI0016623BEE|nr:RidA family protein [Phyllobacterium sp. 628]QND50573.1 RidA family protein [Phyllobacterium sp. 628]
MSHLTSPAIDAGTSPYDRLKELGIVLPPAPRPIANFVTHIQEGNMLYLSGQGPREDDGFMHTGKVGDTVSVEDAYKHARLTGINLLAVLQTALGDLTRVKQIVKLLGMVNAAPDFADHPSVINGCSDLLIDVFGDAGQHARSAVGFGSLPGNITVEIEAIVALKD